MGSTNYVNSYDTVAPLAGAWIEITSETVVAGEEDVAPLAGTWIEIILHSAG